MTDPATTAVITGIGVASPYGVGLEKLNAGLCALACPLGPLQRFHVGFDAIVGEFPNPLEERDDRGRRLSRSAQLAVTAARDLARDTVPGESGVVMATTVAGLSEIEPELVDDPAAWYRGEGLDRARTYPVSQVAEAVGETLGAQGPRCAVNVACASGAMAIALAAEMLLDGAAEIMYAGGSDALAPFTLSGFHSLRALDPALCRPFDTGRGGLNIGEGSAVLRLETQARARQRGAPILAVLSGWAMTNDAFHLTAPHEAGIGVAESIRKALAMAEAGPDDIGYVNAHGTGTPLNDAAETKGYEIAFDGRAEPIPVSSTKSYFGHCLGAAGALEAAVTILAVRDGKLFPTLRLDRPIESRAVDWLAGEVRTRAIGGAVSVSAGFGGSNTALFFGRAA